MPEDVRIITARRAYEFSPDNLRLSVFATQPVMEVLRQAFQFQAAVVGAPIATFGPPLPALPPGVVFNFGVVALDGGGLAPIRFLHVEPTRIVIDVAGPSSCVDTVYNHLCERLHGLKAPDGTPILGKVAKILDHSEITARLNLPVDGLFSAGARRAFQTVLGVDGPGSGLSPTVYVRVQQSNESVGPSTMVGDSLTLHLALRADTRPDENIYYSAAPVDSDAHLSYLSLLEQDFDG